MRFCIHLGYLLLFIKRIKYMRYAAKVFKIDSNYFSSYITSIYIVDYLLVKK